MSEESNLDKESINQEENELENNNINDNLNQINKFSNIKFEDHDFANTCQNFVKTTFDDIISRGEIIYYTIEDKQQREEEKIKMDELKRSRSPYENNEIIKDISYETPQKITLEDKSIREVEEEKTDKNVFSSESYNKVKDIIKKENVKGKRKNKKVRKERYKYPPLTPIFNTKNSKVEKICNNFIDNIFNDYTDSKQKKNINENIISEKDAEILNYYCNYYNQIIQIQKKWKAHYDSQKLFLLKEKVFYIQRAFRNFLIKKYNLPNNFYYNDKFMKIQNEIFEDNYKKNLSVLFPALFLVKSDINNFTSNMVTISNNPSHNPYEQGKINLFAKIIDFDMMIETDECYEVLWSSIFDSIYSKCLKNNSPLQLIALGGQHTLCVNNKGKTFTFGWNNFGQCGVPINSTIISKGELNTDYLVEITKYNELKPKIVNRVESVKMPEIDQVIISNSIACGEDHSLILDQDGAIWAFGLNLNGQLGLGHTNVVEKPTKINSLNRHFITSVKSEGNINFAISKKGDAFIWPWNDKGKIIYSPRKFSLKTPEEKITSIACGDNFAIILGSSGMVYSMGKSNKYGQLGHGDYEPKLHPSIIHFFVSNSERITQISCGYKHCVAKSSVGRAFTWGLGCKGQLGQGNFNNLTIPSQVEFEIKKVLQVSAGFRCTFFLCDNRKIFSCGCNGTISMENIPIPFEIIDKIPEMSLEQHFSIIRIMTTWNKSFSIFYATIADSSNLKISPVKLNNILNQLAAKWDYEGIKAPYIESIAGYFPISFMKKPNPEK